MISLSRACGEELICDIVWISAHESYCFPIWRAPKAAPVKRSGAPHCDPEHFFRRHKMRNKKRRVASGMFYLILCSQQRHISISESACKVSQQTTDWQRNEGDSLAACASTYILCVSVMCSMYFGRARATFGAVVRDWSFASALLFVRLATLWCVTRHDSHKLAAFHALIVYI